ncbi:hypothetical protein ACFZDJ_13500 [Streptomyces sp. NPDC007896]|uniref:hypothetical protein n=1 Tax=Streptomyces sp. NPDC007896 TaxID=3364784 RepID=UPI0036EA69C1
MTEEQEPQALDDDELFDLIGAAGAGIGVAEDEGLPPLSRPSGRHGRCGGRRRLSTRTSSA